MLKKRPLTNTTPADVAAVEMSEEHSERAPLSVNVDPNNDDLKKELKLMVGKTQRPQNISWIFKFARLTKKVQNGTKMYINDEKDGDRRPMTTEEMVSWCRAIRGRPDPVGRELESNDFMHGMYQALAASFLWYLGFGWLESDMAALDFTIERLEDRGTDRAAEKAEELSEIKSELDEIHPAWENGTSAGEEMKDAIYSGDFEKMLEVLGEGDFFLDIGPEP